MITYLPTLFISLYSKRANLGPPALIYAFFLPNLLIIQVLILMSWVSPNAYQVVYLFQNGTCTCLYIFSRWTMQLLPNPVVSSCHYWHPYFCVLSIQSPTQSCITYSNAVSHLNIPVWCTTFIWWMTLNCLNNILISVFYLFI